MALPLFCYGTLELPAVMAAVAGRVPTGMPATLHGYRRALVEGRDYPGIAPADDEVVGTLYLGVGLKALARIDRFEGGEYRRCRVLVTTRSGNVRAWTYLLDTTRARLSATPWQQNAFCRSRLARQLGVPIRNVR